MPSARTVMLVVGVPVALLVGIIVGIGQLEGQFHNAIVAEFGEIPAERVNDLRLSSLCTRPEFASGFSPCDDLRVGQILQAAAWVAIIISALSLVLTIAVARYAGTNRDRLATFFRPTLTILQILVVALILLEGATAIGAGYLIEIGSFGSYHPVVLFGIGLAAAVAAWGVFRATLTMRKRITTDVSGLVVEPRDQPGLTEFAAEVARAVGTSAPETIVVGLDPTFFVIDGDATTSAGQRSGRLLYASLPLMRVLTAAEMRAVVGHEMGHFKGDDTRYSRMFAPVYRSAIDAFGAVSGAARGLSRLVLAPTLEILRLFLDRFTVAERSVQRNRELEADSVGAEIGSPEAVATSLIKLQAYVPLWRDVLNRAGRGVGLGQSPGNPSLAFAERARQGATVTSLAQLEEAVVPHPTDSHPQLRERLRNLSVEFQAVSDQALSGQIDRPAIDLVIDPAPLEQALTDEWVGRVKGAVGVSDPGFDVEGALRAAAADDPVVARAIELIERVHGGTLIRPVDFSVRWRVVVPLALADHPKPRAFASIVDVTTLPPGDQQLIVGFRGANTPHERVLAAGVGLKPVGLNPRAERRAGYAEDFYTDEERVIVVQNVGTGDLAAQLAGLFVVPSTDPLARSSGDLASELAKLVPELLAWQAELEERAATDAPAPTT